MSLFIIAFMHRLTHVHVRSTYAHTNTSMPATYSTHSVRINRVKCVHLTCSHALCAGSLHQYSRQRTQCTNNKHEIKTTERASEREENYSMFSGKRSHTYRYCCCCCCRWMHFIPVTDVSVPVVLCAFFWFTWNCLVHFFCVHSLCIPFSTSYANTCPYSRRW